MPVMFFVALFRMCLLATSEDIPHDPLFTSGIQQVWQGDTMLFEELLGYQHRESETLIARDSQFRIGSNSKTFTTVAILQLADQGLFSIYDNISSYLTEEDLVTWKYDGDLFCPRFNGSSACEPLTFYNLLSMRAGWVNALGCFNYAPGSWQTQYCVPESYFMFYTGGIGESISAFSNVPLEVQPGSAYNYNNGNTIILSYFVEKFSGMNLEEYLRLNVFEPLGFTGTSQDSLAQQLLANAKQVNNYYDYTDLRLSNEYFAYGNAASTEVNQGVQTGAGGFLSTAADMVRFYTSLFVSKNASSILSDENIALMTGPISITQNHSEYGCECFGLGLFMVYKPPCKLNEIETRDYIYYQGVINAATATILMLDDWAKPESDRIVSVAMRNNVIMDTTEDNWNSARLDMHGNLSSIFTKYGMYKYSDSWMVALNNAVYFQQSPVPYVSPTAAPSTCTDDSDGSSISLTAGELAACVIVPTLLTIFSLIGYIHFFVASKLEHVGVKRTSAVVMSPMGNA